MPVFITRDEIDSVAVDAIVCPTDCSLRSDFMHSFRDPALEAVFRMHTKPGDVIVVPPVGSELRYILYVVIEGIENDRDKLARCYSAIFEKAGEYHFQSIALPLFPAYESTSLTPSQIYSIVRRELRHRPADENLVIRLAMGRQGKIPVYKNLIADVRDYMKDARRQFFLSACAPSADASQDKNTYARPRAKCNLPKMPAPDSPKEGMLPQLSNSSRPESFSAEAELVDAEAADFGSDKYYLAPDEDARVPDYQKKINAESLEPFEDINIPLNLQIIDGSFFDPARNTLTLEEGFAEAVLKKIDEKGLTDPQCYTRANLSRAVFNKLKQSAIAPEKYSYSPSKSTALALVIALELSLDDANDLLKKAGFAISHSNRRDIIVEYFLVHHIYDIFAINEVLFRFQQPPLGSL